MAAVSLRASLERSTAAARAFKQAGQSLAVRPSCLDKYATGRRVGPRGCASRPIPSCSFVKRLKGPMRTRERQNRRRG